MAISLRNCAKAIIVRDGKILAVKYADEGGIYYSLPGGGQLHGESLPETLLRECREELGVTVHNLGLKFIREYIGKDGESAWRDTGVHQVEFLFECLLPAGEEPQGGNHQDHAQVDIAWLPIELLAAHRFYPKKLIPYLSHALPDQSEYWGKVD